MKEKYLKRMRTQGLTMIIVGALVILIGAVLLAANLTGLVVPLLIIGIFMAVSGALMLVFGILRIKKGATAMEQDPELAELLDSLDFPLYTDRFVMISEKAIAPAKKPEQLARTADVLGIYERIQSQNGIPVSHTLNLELRTGKTIVLNIYAKKRATKDDLMLTVKSYCPNAMTGYSSEMLSYVKQERKKYAAEKKATK